MTIKNVFNLTLRATIGFLGSEFDLANLDLVIPCYTTICRWVKNLHIGSKFDLDNEPMHVAIDSTSLKVCGIAEVDNVYSVAADGAYNSFDNFEYLDTREIFPLITLRKNAKIAQHRVSS